MSNDILISVFHNAKEYLIPFQKNKTIYELINVIINKFNMILYIQQIKRKWINYKAVCFKRKNIKYI